MSSGSSTPKELEDNLDDTIVQQATESEMADLVKDLMERLKVLEANQARTTLQLIDSEKKRTQLQEKLQTTQTSNKQANVSMPQPSHEGEYANNLSQSTNTQATQIISTESLNNIAKSSTAVQMIEPINSTTVSAPSQYAQYAVTPVANGLPSLGLLSSPSTSMCPPYSGASGSQPPHVNLMLPMSSSMCPPYSGASGSQPPHVHLTSSSSVPLSSSMCPPYSGASGSQPPRVNFMSLLSSSICPPYYGVAGNRPSNYLTFPHESLPTAVGLQFNTNGQQHNATSTGPAPISLSSSYNSSNVSQPNYAATRSLTSMCPSMSVYPAYNSACRDLSSPISYGAARKLYDLPEFSGLPEQWPIFITTFNESTVAYGYTLLENLFRLQKSLKGTAKNEVESLLINTVNVMRIIEQLALKYGQPELLIKSQLQKAYEIDSIDESHLERLVPFATKVQNLTLFLQNANASQHLNNPMLLEKVVSKMPMTKKIEWAAYSSQIHPYATLEHFCVWIAQISKVISKATLSTVPVDSTTINKGQTIFNRTRPRQESKAAMHVANVSQPDNQPTCHNCNGNHSITHCKEFLEKSVDEKWKIVKQLRLCFCCLRKGHNVYGCRRKIACKEKGCKRLHHAILHQNEQQKEPATKLVNTIQNKTTNFLYKVIPVELVGPNQVVIKSYAFMDEGSSATLINEKLARGLGVNVKKENLTLQWFGKYVTNLKTMKCDLRISGVGKDKMWYALSGNSVPNLELPLQTIKLEELHNAYRQLEELPIQDYCEAVPSILIGLNNCHLTRTIESVSCSKNLVASKTPLGWVLYGISKESKENTSCRVSIVLHARVKEDSPIIDEIHNMVEDFFTTESFGVAKPDKPLESTEDSRARDILKKTSKRVGNRFETGLLWINDDVKLPNAYPMALSRLRSVEMKMQKDPEYSQNYKNAVSNFINKGYAVKMTSEEAAKIGPRTWHLPHFAVFNINKPNKFRLVFDAAAAVNTVSLNSVLLKGPDENPPLTKILFQFREGAIGVCADIEEMFLQVKIREKDQDSLRFLWRNGDSMQNVETYKMVSMIFGASCSPCCAQYIKNLNAEEVARNRSEILNAVKNSHYVDDYVCSFGTTEDALKISEAVKRVHKKAGFKLRGFISNSSLVQQQLNEEPYENATPTIQMKTDSVDKILGIYWDCRADEFYFKLQLNRVDTDVVLGKRSPSKRELLSLVMSVYDPFGMLAEYMIYGKVLIQEVWRAGIQWNEAVSENIYEKFKLWISQLDSVKKFSLPLCYSPCLFNDNCSIEIHVFVDASESAFAAVCYWRIVNDQNIEVSFIAGKTRCAPLKMLSIPRLELQAAVLGNRLRNTIIASHNVNVSKSIYWSDSRTVLSWIKSDVRQFKPFVAHRVSEILETSTAKEWRWISTNLNVADMGTRAKYPINYETPNKWTLGPDFLKLPEDEWPNKQVWWRAKNQWPNRTLAWVLRFVDRTRRNSCSTTKCSELTAGELMRAELVLCQMAQSQIYKQEVIDLQNKQTLSKSSDIYKLSPILNKDGVLVINGRLNYAIALPESARHPIILPRRHALSDKIVMWYYQRFHHQNEEIVVNEIRRKFWIPHLRREVKRAKNNCQDCKNNAAKPNPPLMGQLPVDRVKPYVRPFSYTGIDYFGPVVVTIGRRHEKRWVALFTCLTIRAIHVELAADLSTDSCILCIRNFVNRRGVPIKIRSDMGTNFVGTDGEFKKVKDLFDYDRLQTELATRGIQWEFNCPANPSSGGCWERLIRTTKRVLAVTLKTHAPQVETLRSLLIEAENIVNSRPLTHLPVNADDPEPLTPNHFLLGTMNSTQTPGEETYVCTRKQYQISKQLKNMFWHRWIREYLPTLTRRTKWFEPLKSIEKGDVVLICDENQPRNQWRRGVVTKPIMAKDGQSRIAEVRTSNGILRRPVSKLAVLDLIGKLTK